MATKAEELEAAINRMTWDDDLPGEMLEVMEIMALPGISLCRLAGKSVHDYMVKATTDQVEALWTLLMVRELARRRGEAKRAADAINLLQMRVTELEGEQPNAKHPRDASGSPAGHDAPVGGDEIPARSSPGIDVAKRGRKLHGESAAGRKGGGRNADAPADAASRPKGLQARPNAKKAKAKKKAKRKTKSRKR